MSCHPAGTTVDVVEVERYDPYNKSWCAISPALKYVSNFAAASCLGKLYLVGSCAVKYNALTLQCYNPVQGEGSPCCHTPPVLSLGDGLRGAPRQVPPWTARHGPVGCEQVLTGCGDGCGTGPRSPRSVAVSSTELSHRCLTQPRPELRWNGISEA